MGFDYLNTDFEKVSYIQNLLIARATGGFADPEEYEMLRHELIGNPELANHLPLSIKLNRNLDSFWNFIKAKFSSYAERRTYLSEEFTPIIDLLEFGKGGITQQFATDRETVMKKSPINTSVPRIKRKVFIVHGRDNETKQEVGRFIEKVGLEAIILHEQASSGMTIIEKIEHYANDADFALGLYTACDLGRGAHESKYR